MAQQWKVGDIVMLKSGGPEMTVTYVGDSLGTPVIQCQWFDGKKVVEGTFPPDALQAA